MKLLRVLMVAMFVAAPLALAGSTVSTAALPEGQCPPQLSGKWAGEADSTTTPGANNTISGNIDITDSVMTGPVDVGFTPGQWTGQIDCADVTGTFDGFSQGPVSFVATLSDDGRNLIGTYDFPDFPDNGTFAIAISAPPESAGASDESVFEGGDNGGAGFTAASKMTAKATTQAQAVKPLPRVAQMPVSFNAPSSKRIIVHYRLVPDTAVAGVDYIDNGQVHTLIVRARQTLVYIPVSIIPNPVREPNRALRVEIADAGTHDIFAKIGTLTILDDD